MRKGVIGTLCAIIALYVGVCIYFYMIQNSILFHPTKLSEGHSFNYSFDFEERWFEFEESSIHSIYAKADSSKGLVIFFHGNAGSADTSPSKIELFLNQNYDVLYPDCREYGLSKGDLWNEEDLVGDMTEIFRQMTSEYNEEDIIIVGYSMGSGVAAQVASQFDPKKLILWTPYYSMLDMKNANYSFLPDFLVRYPLRTDLALQKIEEPITIFYAEEDEVLPVERAIKLTAFLDENDSYIMLEDQGHNHVYRNEVLIAEMNKILAN